MKLWILRPIGYEFPNFWHKYVSVSWTPWYDRVFGFVVRADTAKDARNWASTRAGDEGGGAWLDDKQSTCEELTREGDQGIIIVDFALSWEPRPKMAGD